MAYERLGNFRRSKLGSFERLGDFGLTKAQKDQQVAAAKAELQAAQQEMAKAAQAAHTPVTCHAIPGMPSLPKIACPTTVAQVQPALDRAGKRVEAAKARLEQAQNAPVNSGESAESIMRGVAAITTSLANPFAQVFATKMQLDAAKRGVSLPGAGMDTGMPAMSMQPASSSNTGIILAVGGGLLLVIVLLVVMGGKKD